jgi:hypothetical protein
VSPERRRYALALAGLAVAFLARVVGQALVAFLDVRFLPPMEEWYSGLLPYPLLLPAQVAILAFQAAVTVQLWTGSGTLARPRSRLGERLALASALYFLLMVARYALTMALFPELRWVGRSLPTFFHCVLAAYLYLLSRYHRGLLLRLGVAGGAAAASLRGAARGPRATARPRASG